jgi:hypothetical protein
VVPSGGAECFEALDLGLDVVGLKVEVHAFLRYLRVVGADIASANDGGGATDEGDDGGGVVVPLR